jgi:hypothetical protein
MAETFSLAYRGNRNVEIFGIVSSRINRRSDKSILEDLVRTVT